MVALRTYSLATKKGIQVNNLNPLSFSWGERWDFDPFFAFFPVPPIFFTLLLNDLILHCFSYYFVADHFTLFPYVSPKVGDMWGTEDEMSNWVKTHYPDVRYREHPTRKHNIKRFHRLRDMPIFALTKNKTLSS